MPKMIGINIGFVTNSSSMVYHFPKTLLEDPQIKSFFEAMEIEDGFIGNDLWHRGECGSVLITPEQKQEAARQLASSEYCTGPGIDQTDEYVVVIYGDEHPGLALTVSHLLQEAAKRAGVTDIGGSEYN